MAKSFQEVLDYRELTEAFRNVSPLNEYPFTNEFWTGKTNRPVSSDQVEMVLIGSNSRPGAANVRGGKARVISMRGVSTAKLGMFRYFTNLPLPGDALKALRDFNSHSMQAKGEQIVELANEDARERHGIFREVVLANTMSTGRVCLDGDGELLVPTVDASTGVITDPASTVISADFGVPDANRGNLGGIIDVLWSDASAKIIDHIEAIDDACVRAGVPKIETIYCHATNKKHLRNNTQFKEWLQANGLIANQVMQGGMLEGFGGKKWKFVDGVWEDKNNAQQELMPKDRVIMHPKEGGWMRRYRGKELVPTKIGVFSGSSLTDALKNTREVTGMFSYVKLTDDPVMLNQYHGDNFVAAFAQPKAPKMPTVFSN